MLTLYYLSRKMLLLFELTLYQIRLKSDHKCGSSGGRVGPLTGNEVSPFLLFFSSYTLSIRLRIGKHFIPRLLFRLRLLASYHTQGDPDASKSNQQPMRHSDG